MSLFFLKKLYLSLLAIFFMIFALKMKINQGPCIWIVLGPCTLFVKFTPYLETNTHFPQKW